MNFKLIYIQPFLLWLSLTVVYCEPVVGVVIDDGYQELCKSRAYQCQCPVVTTNTNGTVVEIDSSHSQTTTTTIDCSDRDLQNTSQFIRFPDNIDTILFNNNKIKSIVQNTFVEGRHVNVMDLSNNNIDYIHHSVFQPLENLQKLVLAHNQLWNLDTNLFDGLQLLQTLDLSYNLIQSWDSSVFSPSSRRLRQLYLNHNDIGSVGLTYRAFEHLPQLEILNLETTGLRDLPDHIFSTNYKLKSLYLSGNNFQTVPNAGLQSAPGLRLLDMSATKLQTIEYNDFMGLKSLTELRLERMSSLESIKPYAFGDLQSLQIFVCKHNYRLTEIHSKAFTNNLTTEQPSGLSSLILRHNSFKTLSDQLVNWQTVSRIDLSGNPWICDCRMKWLPAMVDTKHRLMNTTKCYEPSGLSGRSIGSLTSDDFDCRSGNDLFLLILILAMIMSTVGIITITYLCRQKYRFVQTMYTSGRSVFTTKSVQKEDDFDYFNVVSNNKDLEWDDSAEP
ncbi:leucine-rich repeat neuronal protein 2-like [Oppia nitens]|uniref:leucine-rich repeat neuronal protein 2-like n=1 Tax=Oppia nitens TaxID=1686743 RepID=UPI0023DAAEE9|nr:leucine-rich repeat neuronal protein 2-like [Oppia nitens]